MSNFQGYLLKFGNSIFPHGYLAFDNYDETPNQRTEADAWTDGFNVLHRETYSKYRSKIDYSTIDGLTLEQKMEVQEAIAKGLINATERKHNVTYWNDETNSYVTGEFYIPDIVYRIKEIDRDNKTIIYGPIRFALIEY